MPKSKSKNKFNYKFNVVPDAIDFRDKMYVATLVEVPPEKKVSEYSKLKIPVLNQGETNHCTGYALASLTNFLLRTRKVTPEKDARVSPRMFYETAKRYDEWSGENYEGSSCRGAIKGWHKHGVCKENLWTDAENETILSEERAIDALNYPLGAYFRVNHRDIRAMHSAISETGILYVSGAIHVNWFHDNVKKSKGRIAFDPNKIPRYWNLVKEKSGHAFVIVAYDSEGFWIQNSWGLDWGLSGLARISYDDWLLNGSDVWALRLGVPLNLSKKLASDEYYSPVSASLSLENKFKLDPYVISIGNDGKLATTGDFAKSIEEIDKLIIQNFIRRTSDWKRKRVMFYAHGGLVGESTMYQRISDYLNFCLPNEIYPIFFIWHTDIWSTLQYIVEDTIKKHMPDLHVGGIWNFILDKLRLDNTIEKITRTSGRKFWSQMKGNAQLAITDNNGGARITANLVIEKLSVLKGFEQHFVAHSAGSIFFAGMVDYLAAMGIKTASCNLWAPACTMELFGKTYKPLLENKSIEKFSLFTLTDTDERDDNCLNLYLKSLLYLVSNSFEDNTERGSQHLLGMEKFIKQNNFFRSFAGNMNSDRCIIKSDSGLMNAHKHNDLDDDEVGVKNTMLYINKSFKGEVSFHRSNASIDKTRQNILSNIQAG